MPIKEFPGSNIKEKGEYHSVHSFFDDPSDDEVGSEFDDNKSVQSEGPRPPLAKKPSATKPLKNVDDRLAMKDLLVKELKKNLSTTTLMANREAMTTLMTNTRKKSMNDMHDTKITFTKSKEACTIETTKVTGGTDNLWLESKKKELIAKKKSDSKKDTVQPEDHFNPVKPESNSNKHSEAAINNPNRNINDTQKNVEEPPKIPERRGSANNNSDVEDEKKKAAIERSLNASNYLLQNWGFKNRNSLARIKDDLQKLQYGKLCCVSIPYSFLIRFYALYNFVIFYKND